MGELSFLLRKAAIDREKEARDWKISHLQHSVIPHLEHELKTVKELGLEYVSVHSKLEHCKQEYRILTGQDYKSC